MPSDTPQPNGNINGLAHYFFDPAARTLESPRISNACDHLFRMYRTFNGNGLNHHIGQNTLWRLVEFL